jgi:hypothetical protein
VCAAREAPIAVPSAVWGRLHGARLHHLCRGLVTVLRGLCRALEAEEEEARRFRAAPMRYGPIDRHERAAAAAAATACAAACASAASVASVTGQGDKLDFKILISPYTFGSLLCI